MKDPDDQIKRNVSIPYNGWKKQLQKEIECNTTGGMTQSKGKKEKIIHEKSETIVPYQSKVPY